MSVSTGTYVSRPSSHSAGDIYLTTDSFWDYLVSNGTKWRHLYSGFECEPPVDSEFSWINQGGASTDATHGGVYLHAPTNSGVSIRMRVKTKPATPYTLTAILLPTFPGVNSFGTGILLRQSSNGYYHGINIAYTLNGARLTVTRGSGPTDATHSATFLLDVDVSSPAIWFRITDDGNNAIESFSLDGQNFVDLWTDAYEVFTAEPDQIGFILSVDNTIYDAGATLIHWSQPNPVSTLRAFGMFGVIPSFEPTGNAFGAFG